MNLERVLLDLGLHSVTSCTEIQGGEDCSVWKIQTSQGTSYALRLLPRQRHGQFVQEQKFIELAVYSGIPVPKVYSVKRSGDWSAMLMEWAPGRTLLEELTTNLDKGYSLGLEFGRVQAAIHKISVPKSMGKKTEGWFAPRTDEEIEILEKIALAEGGPQEVLLHLDFHPLNVLTDGQIITGVIDWSNAATGDPRFDIARTLSILQLEGKRSDLVPKKAQEVMIDFEKGWIEGYERSAGRPGSLSLFNAWAGARMIQDLAGRREEGHLLLIRRWMESWLQDADSKR